MSIKSLYGLNVAIPEPRMTTGMNTNQILSLIEKHYKHGKLGREYNLITMYTNAIHNKIFGNGKYNLEDFIFIKYTHVRSEWIQAALKYKTGIKIKIDDGGLIYEGKPII